MPKLDLFSPSILETMGVKILGEGGRGGTIVVTLEKTEHPVYLYSLCNIFILC